MTAGMRLLLAALTLSALAAQVAASSPVDGVSFSPRDDARLPIDAQVIDEMSRAGPLGDYWRVRPALVVPAYYGCSNLCTTVLQALATSLSRTDIVVGRDVEVVVLSIDPLDSPASARAKKYEVLAGRESTGWHFLSASSNSIDAIARALGYRYAYDDAHRQFAHASGAAVVARDGHVVRVVNPLESGNLRADIAMAAGNAGNVHNSDGAFGAVRAVRGAKLFAINGAGLRARWLLCYHYDPATGRYTFAAWNAVRIIATATFAALLLFIIRARLHERRALRDV